MPGPCPGAGCEGWRAAGVALLHRPPVRSPRSLPQRLALPLVLLLEHAQPGNKTGVVSGAFVIDTECMECFLVGREPTCLQEQPFEEAKKSRTDISLVIY